MLHKVYTSICIWQFLLARLQVQFRYNIQRLFVCHFLVDYI